MRRAEIEFTKNGCIVPVPEGPIRILQLTDIQVIDSSQQRYAGRLCDAEAERWRPEKVWDNAFKYVDEAIKRTDPHLLIITGDNVYGEFDDSGVQNEAFVKFIDSFGIPWATVFGNHDNETQKGPDWQCDLLENAEYSLFMRGDAGAEGCGNYTVTLTQNGAPLRTLLMCDTHGCGIVPGIHPGQVNLFRNALGELRTRFGTLPPLFACYHIGSDEYFRTYINAGYQGEDGVYKFYELDRDIPARPGDFGRKNEGQGQAGDTSAFIQLLRDNGGDGVFAGHYHRINTSVVNPADGIRYTFGLKTGTYDYHDADRLGGTLITLNSSRKGDFKVEHIVSKL